MKDILDTIIHVEQKIQGEIVDAQKKAVIILNNAQKKAEALEIAYEKEFEEERAKKREKLEKKYADYSARRLEKTKNEMSRLKKSSEESKAKILKILLDSLKKEIESL